jgi:osmoprotectant transport system permease protein
VRAATQPTLGVFGVFGVMLAGALALGGWGARVANAAPAGHVVVGSKAFTEGYVMGEIAAQTIESASTVKVDRKLGMGSTGILFAAVKSGAIDVYPDYTGTLSEAILKRPDLKSVADIQQAMLGMNLVVSDSLGFNDTYALALRESFAQQNGLERLSDLARVRDSIRAAFSYEFMDRKDGYPALMDKYQLQLAPAHVARMEHSLSFQAIDDGAVDLIDVYSTDAKIEKSKLRLLTDDRGIFPAYQAVWVARKAFVDAHPQEWAALLKLQGSISETAMRDMNAQADLQKVSFAKIASDFLGKEAPRAQGWHSSVWQRTREHLSLVGASLLFSVLVGIPLGLLAVRYHTAGQGILIVSAVIQTVPSLALLCFLIPLFGVGTKPALAALCMYSLLPVVLNTFTGVRSVDPKHVENARAFGMNGRQVLWRVVLPLASPMLLAGIKNATIVGIGTATLAALVGAGGYGAPIVSGLSLNDVPTILTGAVPAALMALAAYGLFELLGWLLIPAGLRPR